MRKKQRLDQRRTVYQMQNFSKRSSASDSSLRQFFPLRRLAQFLQLLISRVLAGEDILHEGKKIVAVCDNPEIPHLQLGFRPYEIAYEF
ncbi:hypothetical protein PMAYCL1PPCAC_01485, partial [Pristionchus mayeri]